MTAYICGIFSHVCNGLLSILIICRYGDISLGVGILVILPGYAYFWCISVRRPPLAGVYGILCCMHLVRACVLLKINLYFGNRFCMYLVAFVADILVSCIVMMAGSSGVLVISSCKFGRAVFSDEAFHVINLVL